MFTELFATRPDYAGRFHSFLRQIGIHEKRMTARGPNADRSLEGQTVNGKTLTVDEARARRQWLSKARNLTPEDGRRRVRACRDDIQRAVSFHPRGERVRAAIRAGRVTQAWFARETGIHKTQIAALDRREPKVGRALKVARTLGVTVEDLWG